MRSSEALETGLAMLQRPQLARLALRSPLPRGVTLLLEVAAGEAGALSEARALTRRSRPSLQTAASFFIEQVLLSREGDSYRVLGATCDASAADLRRHMALLMKWLHPDLVSNGGSNGEFDRSVYVNRVTEAWETVKTNERRTAYDALLAASRTKAAKSQTNRKREAASIGRSSRQRAQASKRQSARQLTLFRLEREGFLSRVMVFLRGRR
jgi:hypothetical protein